MSPDQPPAKIGKSVGEKLRAARIAQHYTQSQLAAPDFSVSYISAIERGQIHPSLRALEILAGRLGLTPTELFPSHPQQDEYLRSPANLTEQDEDEVEFALLEAHFLIMHNNVAEAMVKLDIFATKDLKPAFLLRQRYLQGLAYFKADQLQQSEYVLSEAEQIAKNLHADSLLLHILNQLALTYAAMHNYTQALQVYQHCLELIEGNQKLDPFCAIQVYSSTGHHYIRLESFDRAFEAFNKALIIAGELPTSQHVQAIYAHLCQHYITEKDYQLATLYAHKSIQANYRDMIKQLKIKLHHYLGHALMRKDAQAAQDYIAATLQKPDILQSHETQASLITRKAEWHLAQQELDEAELNARHAHELVQSFGDSLVDAEALIMLGRIEFAQGRYEEASQQFAVGLDMLERLENHEELADESVRYAQLLEKIGKEREAFMYFRCAFQSRQKLGK
ncbi:MAG TPA: tetratricopeptide repeat protein [Ktedonobacteraceae bacterium]|jgi:transcriptional regulator with XRE-family HTH domain